MASWKPPGPSAFDDNPWPEQLVARAIDADPADDHLHGYAVLGELSQHVGFTDVLYLAITGELPTPRAAGLFQLALLSLATPSVAEAPTHVAILARIASAPLASALAAGLATAAEQARDLLATQAELLTWLAAPTGELPAVARGEDQSWIATLSEAVARISDETLLRPEMNRDAARIALLYTSGLHTPEQMVAAMLAARVVGLSAEALATGPQHIGNYPVNLPPFRYVEDDE